MWHLCLTQRRVGGDPIYHDCNSLTKKSMIIIRESISAKQRNSSPAFLGLSSPIFAGVSLAQRGVGENGDGASRE